MSQKEKVSLKETLERKIKELSALYEVGKSLTSTLRLNNVLNLITNRAARIMGASACSLRLLDSSGGQLLLKSSYGFGGKNFQTSRIREIIAEKVVRNERPYIINDLRRESYYRYFHIAKKRGLCSLISVPLEQRGKVIGALSIYNIRPRKFTQEDVRLLSMFASQAAIAIENARLYEQAQTGYLNTIQTLSNIIDAKDSQTYGHSERVMRHCMEVAERLGLSEREKEVLKYASLLHDIGKIGIDVGILRKPAKLNDDEWNVMFMHPVIGSGIVEQIGFLDDLAPIILHHHERYDGKGYPSRLKKNKIPLGARILAVVDAYESMVSDRPYRKALSFQKACKELITGSGKQFDPKIVKVFLRIVNKRRRPYR